MSYYSGAGHYRGRGPWLEQDEGRLWSRSWPTQDDADVVAGQHVKPTRLRVYAERWIHTDHETVIWEFPAEHEHLGICSDGRCRLLLADILATLK